MVKSWLNSPHWKLRIMTISYVNNSTVVITIKAYCTNTSTNLFAILKFKSLYSKTVKKIYTYTFRMIN
jgi:hypothetical protein